MTVGNAFQALESTLKNPDSPPVPNQKGASVSNPDKEDILDWNKPAGTIRCGGRAFHPTLNRAINVREATTLQSYPHCYEFTGSLTDQYKLVGNAVPGKMAKAVALAVAESLRFVYDEENNEKELSANGKPEEVDAQNGVAETDQGDMEIENESGAGKNEEAVAEQSPAESSGPSDPND